MIGPVRCCATQSHRIASTRYMLLRIIPGAITATMTEEREARHVYIALRYMIGLLC